MTNDGKKLSAFQRAKLALQNRVELRYRKGKIVAPVRTKTGAPIPVSYPYGVKSSGYAAGYHTGEDHACPIGSSATATSYGRVVGAGWSGGSMGWGSAYGNVVVIRTGDGKYDYGFCHLSRIDVREGDEVRPGEQIGLTGNTGNSTGPHCHFEARPAGGRYGNTVHPRTVKKIRS